MAIASVTACHSDCAVRSEASACSRDVLLAPSQTIPAMIAVKDRRATSRLWARNHIGEKDNAADTNRDTGDEHAFPAALDHVVEMMDVVFDFREAGLNGVIAHRLGLSQSNERGEDRRAREGGPPVRPAPACGPRNSLRDLRRGVPLGSRLGDLRLGLSLGSGLRDLRLALSFRSGLRTCAWVWPSGPSAKAAGLTKMAVLSKGMRRICPVVSFSFKRAWARCVTT